MADFKVDSMETRIRELWSNSKQGEIIEYSDKNLAFEGLVLSIILT